MYGYGFGNIINKINILQSFSTSYLLDTYSSSAIVGYSLRKLSSTATVSCRVRRSSDNVEQDIGFVGDNLDTTSLLSFIGANNGWIVKMYDQKGTGKNLTQSTASAQFQIVNVGSLITNSLGQVTALTNSLDFMDTPTTLGIPNLTNGYSVFGVTQTVSQVSSGTNNVNYYWDITNGTSSSTTDRLMLNGVLGSPGNPTTLRSAVQAGQIDAIDTPYSTGVKLLSNTFNINNHRFWVNNSLIGATTPTLVSYTGNTKLRINDSGWLVSNAPANQKFNEIILFNTDMTTEVNNINTNINSYYGIY